MRVLWIKSDFPLPADTGGKIRTKHLLTELAKLGDVSFLSYVPPDQETKFINQLRGFGIKVMTVLRAEEVKEGWRFYARVLSKIFSQRPYIVSKYVSEEMRDRLLESIQKDKIDVVLCDFLEMSWCADLITDLPVVLFEHNVETLIWRRYHEIETNAFKRLYFAFEKRRMETYERKACGKVKVVLTVSDNDGKLLMKEFGLRKYVTIPTGVDTTYFHPLGNEKKARLVFCGSMDWMPNIDGFWWFYKSIYPQIKQAMKDVSFVVVGRRPSSDIIVVTKTDPSVIVTGTVDDVRPEVAAAQLYVVPLRVGGGTRIKIFEAMAMKKCVVSTSVGAEGLPVTNGVDVIIVDGEENFAKKVTELLHDDRERNRIADAGHRLVTERYGWSKAAGKLHTALQSVVGREP